VIKAYLGYSDIDRLREKLNPSREVA